MRLLNTYTGDFEEFFSSSDTPPYAILSHTWDPKGEQTYQAVREIQGIYKKSSSLSVPILLAGPSGRSRVAALHESAFVADLEVVEGSTPLLDSESDIWSDHRLSPKIREACKVARREGYQYIWIDSSCIDKTSSSELSEAINSMYDWYRGAHVCYAYLSTVPHDDAIPDANSEFRKSRWFRRAWTLQELLAPRRLVFLSAGWEPIGTKDTLSEVVCDITHIDRRFLTHEKPLSKASVAQRMSWAAGREATRVEDQAYSLLGIFGITMPTLYGEGTLAFRRLQEEILSKIPDQSLFAWGSVYPLSTSSTSDDPLRYTLLTLPSESFFAVSPLNFLGSNAIVSPSSETLAYFQLPPFDYAATRATLRLLPIKELDIPVSLPSGPDKWFLAVLGCSSESANCGPRKLLARVCYIRVSESQSNLLYPGMIMIHAASTSVNPADDRPRGVHILALSPDDIKRNWRAQKQIKTVYLPYPERATGTPEKQTSPDPLALVLSDWSHATLRKDCCCRVSKVQGPTKLHPSSHSFALISDNFTIYISFLHMVQGEDGEFLMVVARIWMLSPHDSHDLDAIETRARVAAPYAATTWASDGQWPAVLPSRNITLVLPSKAEATLKFRLDLVQSWYHIHVAIAHGTKLKPPPPFPPAPCPTAPFRPPSPGEEPCRLKTPHTCIKLMLLGCVGRQLQAKGYPDVRFEGPSQDDPQTHTLTLSNAEFIVTVMFVHELRDPYELALVAHVTLYSPSLPGEPSEAYQDGPHTLSWMDRCSKSGGKGWEWSLDLRQIALTGPSGERLMLHLGFDLAWQSEYYVHADIVQLDPEADAARLPVDELSVDDLS